MKYDCKIIEDLLPLYKDGVCSEESSRIVEEHIAECTSCAKMLGVLKDTTIDDMIIKEKENVIKSQSKFFKRKSAVAGSIIAGIFAIPILVCLIVNLATGHALNWFFIVLAAMLIPTSLFVVPFMVPKNRMFSTMTSFTASVIILLGVCNIFSGGNWFIIAASAVLFGLTICFSPFIACRRPVNAYLKNFKGVAVMAAITLTFYLMIICIGLVVKSSTYFGLAFSISVPIFLLIWVIFLIIRYLPVNGFIKAGICIAVISLFVFFGTEAIVFLAMKAAKSSVMYYSTPNMMTMIAGLIIGAIFAVVGIISGKKKENSNE